MRTWRDFKPNFFERHYLPYKAAERAAREAREGREAASESGAE